MGRAALSDSDKRKQIAVRFGPDDREVLRVAAEANGRSMGAEIEARVTASLRFDAQTRALLDAIGTEILAIQSITRKRWHADLSTWAAVAEMLKRGPAALARPERDRLLDDEDVASSLDAIAKVKAQKRDVIDALASVGVRASPTRTSSGPVLKGGMFGGGAAPLLDFRRLERATCDAIQEDDIRAHAIDLFEELVRLDSEEAAAETDYKAAAKPYYDAEARGREAYRERRQTAALERADAGDFTSYLELLF